MYRVTLLSLLASVPPLVAGDTPPSDVVRLRTRTEAHVSGAAPTLADVLVFPSDDQTLRTAVGDQFVAVGPGAGATTSITHEQIEQRLRELGVDVSRVLISGSTSCRIVREAADAGSPGGAAPATLVQPAVGDDAKGERNLAGVLRGQIAKELGGLGGTIEVEFEQAGRQFLDLTNPPWEFAVQPHGRQKLGLCEFRVVLRRDGKVQRTVNVCARVRLSKDVLLARSPLSVGAYVQTDSLKLETRVFDKEEDIGLAQVEQAVGQQVAKFVPAGQMVRRTDLKAVDLVQRSRPVTLIGAGKNVHLRLTGVAMDSGGYGQSVRVRLGDMHDQRRVLRGVVTGLGTVRIEEEGT
jgi:flagella basal body P-ring formation protein FlgA